MKRVWKRKELPPLKPRGGKLAPLVVGKAEDESLET